MQRAAPHGAEKGGGEEVRKDKLNPKAANLIAEALDADERTERFLRQMIPSIGLQEKVADEDYEAPQEP